MISQYRTWSLLLYVTALIAGYNQVLSDAEPTSLQKLEQLKVELQKLVFQLLGSTAKKSDIDEIQKATDDFELAMKKLYQQIYDAFSSKETGQILRKYELYVRNISKELEHDISKFDKGLREQTDLGKWSDELEKTKKKLEKITEEFIKTSKLDEHMNRVESLEKACARTAENLSFELYKIFSKQYKEIHKEIHQ